MAKYSISGLKSFRGREGMGFNANLLCDGKKVAFVYDDANGGAYSFEWEDHNKPRVDVKVRDFRDQDHIYKGTPNEAAFAATVYAMPRRKPCDLFPEGRFVDMEAFMAQLVDHEDTLKQFRTKRKVIFWVDKQLRETKAIPKTVPFDSVAKIIQEKYPSAIIVNNADYATLEKHGILEALDFDF